MIVFDRDGECDPKQFEGRRIVSVTQTSASWIITFEYGDSVHVFGDHDYQVFWGKVK